MANGELFSLLEEYVERLSATEITLRNNGNKLVFTPMFGAIHVNMTRKRELSLINGATYLKTMPKEHLITGRIEVRMGDYEHGSSVAHTLFPLPLSFNHEVASRLIKRTFDENIWDSLMDYQQRIMLGLGIESEKDRFLRFSKEEPAQYFDNRHLPRIDFRSLQETLEHAGSKLREQGLFSNIIDFTSYDTQRYFINTEGTKIYTKELVWELGLNVRDKDSNARVLLNGKTYHGKDNNRFPKLEELIENGLRLHSELQEIKDAPIEKNGTYPAILDYENHGVLWHEVVGHSLEGHRQQDGEWGDSANLFADRLNEKVAPSFLTIRDDPTIKDQFGHYLYDEEGVPAQEVKMIEDGVMKGFLHSRESAGYMKQKSNGHCRAEGVNDPVSRMSNLIIDSTNTGNFDELKERVIKECKRRHIPYGLYLKGCAGGETLPEDSMFNTQPLHVFRIYPDGSMKRSRGIYLVGTPDNAVQNILMTGDEQKTFNGFCGAESGYIKTAITAPDAVLKAIEVNRIPSSSYPLIRDPVLAEKKE